MGHGTPVDHPTGLQRSVAPTTPGSPTAAVQLPVTAVIATGKKDAKPAATAPDKRAPITGEGTAQASTYSPLRANRHRRDTRVELEVAAASGSGPPPASYSLLFGQLEHCTW